MAKLKADNWVGGSCAAHSIDNLGSMTDAESAMVSFYKSQIGTKGKWSVDSNILACHYIFIAGPEVKGKGHSKEWVKYGTEFAAFIRAHKLGRLVTLPKVVNKRYHPDTNCQVWLWQPDQKALEAWWKDLSKEVKEPKVTLLRPEPREGSAKRCPRCGNGVAKHDEKWKCEVSYYGTNFWPVYMDEETGNYVNELPKG
jgi:ribosomal protein S27AE